MDGIRNAQQALALRLRSLRGERPRRVIAERAQLSLRTLEELEGAKPSTNPTLITLHSLAKANGVSIVELFDDTPDPDSKTKT